MNQILKLLFGGKPLSTEHFRKILGFSRKEIDAEFAESTEKNGLTEWPSLLNSGNNEPIVNALIELRIDSKVKSEVDTLAKTISKFEHVNSYYLIGGTSNLLLFAKAESLYDMAKFICEKLTRIKGIASTKTRLLLKSYKQNGLATTKADEYHDPLTVKAIEVIRANGKVRTALLQRKLRIGYVRAARIMDEIEARGIVAVNQS